MLGLLGISEFLLFCLRGSLCVAQAGLGLAI
jgi:hypothetical protein